MGCVEASRVDYRPLSKSGLNDNLAKEDRWNLRQAHRSVEATVSHSR
jgi:hypothetical protein